MWNSWVIRSFYVNSLRSGQTVLHNAAQFYIPTSKAPRFQFLYILASTCFLLFFFFFHFQRLQRQHLINRCFLLMSWLPQQMPSGHAGGIMARRCLGAHLPLAPALLAPHPLLPLRPCAFPRCASSAPALQQSFWQGGWPDARPAGVSACWGRPVSTWPCCCSDTVLSASQCFILQLPIVAAPSYLSPGHFDKPLSNNAFRVLNTGVCDEAQETLLPREETDIYKD